MSKETKLSGLKVLIVDDSPSVCNHLELKFEDKGLSVVSAGSVASALMALKQEPKFDFAIVDMYIPEQDNSEEDRVMRGEELCYDIRNTQKDTIIIGMSSNIDRQPYTPVNELFSRFVFKEDVLGVDNRDFFLNMMEGLHESRRTNLPRNFIVHGHDVNLLSDLKQFLQNKLGYPEPVVLQDEPNTGLTIIEKFERMSSDVDVIFVLLTPDDKVETQNGVVYRARPNVVFELGYFFSKFRRTSGRINLLVRDDVEIPSDLSGVEFFDVSNGVNAVSERLRQKFKELGFAVPK